MKDVIQKASEEISIVIYDAPLPPKYFKITKSLIKTLFVVAPVLFLLLLLGLFTWGLGSRVKEAPTPSLPSVVTTVEDTEVRELRSEIKALQDSNQKLSEKLAGGQAATTTKEEDPYLLSIKRPYGMQNLLAQNKVTLDQFQLEELGNKTQLKFQIISSTPETKVMGHVLVFMLSESGIVGYPKAANDAFAEGIKYSMGEPFSVSRLRPTIAEFTTRPSGATAKFIIYIFSREGDLLLIKETESYKIKAK